MMLRLDHLAVSVSRLEDGVTWLERVLGVTMAGGGKHPHMGTHNWLLGLGDLYLEIIAVDPDAPRPAWARWFDLDAFSGPPRLTNWVCRTDDLDAAIAEAPQGAGTPIALERGDLRWRMAVSADGRLPFDEAYPALIQWQGERHPARALPDAGVRLERFEIVHPKADALKRALHLDDPRVVLCRGPYKSMRAVLSTPQGTRALT
jgi:catechol 2,3-dioxygenase-like lactoylglutathione lyase family enzyme